MESLHLEDTEKEAPKTDDEKAELRKFSKRYSPEWRHQIAEEVRDLRQMYFEKEKGNPDRYEHLRHSEADLERLKGEQQKIEEAIKTLETELGERKEKLWAKVVDLFRKEALEQELGLQIENKKLEDIKEQVHARLVNINSINRSILDTSDLERAKQKLKEFYGEQTELKSQYESEEDVRSVQKIAEREGVLFIHGMPTENTYTANTAHNNERSNTNIPEEAKLKIIAGFEPTIAASTIKEGDTDNNMFYPFGVILGGGQVVSAHEKDAATLATGLYTRGPKRHEKLQKTVIQENSEDAIRKSIGQRESWMGKEYNEFIVENPKIAGIFVNIDFPLYSGKKDVIDPEKIERYAKELGVPIFIWKDGKLHQYKSLIGEEKKYKAYEEAGEKYVRQVYVETKHIGAGEEIGLTNPLQSRRDFSPEQKMKFVDDSIQMKSFKLDNLEKVAFENYHNGQSSWDGFEGYKNFIREKTTYELKNEEEKKYAFCPPPLSDILESKRADLVNLKIDIGIVKDKERIQPSFVAKLYSLYGFAEAAKQAGDDETYEKVLAIANQFGSEEECRRLIEKRTDKDGQFKVLDEDLPFEVRQRIKELKADQHES